jgi:hypothetical protein
MPLFATRKYHCKIASILLDAGADIASKGWIQINDVWKFGSPLELAFQLQHEKESSPWKKSVQKMIDALLEKQHQLSLKMSKEGNMIISSR